MKKPDKDKKLHMTTLPATLVLILIALLLVFVGYVYLSLKSNYTIDDLIDDIVGNLIGVMGAFLLFDIIYNKLTQDEYARLFNFLKEEHLEYFVTAGNVSEIYGSWHTRKGVESSEKIN